MPYHLQKTPAYYRYTYTDPTILCKHMSILTTAELKTYQSIKMAPTLRRILVILNTISVHKFSYTPSN